MILPSRRLAVAVIVGAGVGAAVFVIVYALLMLGHLPPWHLVLLSGALAGGFATASGLLLLGLFTAAGLLLDRWEARAAHRPALDLDEEPDLEEDMEELPEPAPAPGESLEDVWSELREPIARARTSLGAAPPAGSPSRRVVEAWAELTAAEHAIDALLLDVALEARDALELAPRDVVPMVRAAVQDEEPYAKVQGVTIGRRLPGAEVVPAHPMLAHAVRHLVSRAIRRARRGGHVTVRVEPRPNATVISVTDHGRLLRPLDRRDFEARGWDVAGVPLARRVAVLHGGGVTTEADGSGGITVSMVIPRGSVDDLDEDEATVTSAGEAAA